MNRRVLMTSAAAFLMSPLRVRAAESVEIEAFDAAGKSFEAAKAGKRPSDAAGLNTNGLRFQRCFGRGALVCPGD